MSESINVEALFNTGLVVSEMLYVEWVVKPYTLGQCRSITKAFTWYIVLLT